MKSFVQTGVYKNGEFFPNTSSLEMLSAYFMNDMPENEFQE